MIGYLSSSKLIQLCAAVERINGEADPHGVFLPVRTKGAELSDSAQVCAKNGAYRLHAPSG